MLTRFSQYCQTWIQEVPTWNWWLQQFDRHLTSQIPEGIIATWYHGRPALLFHPTWLENMTPATFNVEVEHAITHFILGHASYYAAYSTSVGVDDLLDGQVAYHLGQLPSSLEDKFGWSGTLSKGLETPIMALPKPLTSGRKMHQVWLEQLPQEREVNDLFYQQILGRATQVGSAGGYPRLDAFLASKSASTPLSWQQVLRRFVWRFGRKVMAYSNHRKSKRYGTYPGIKHRKKGSLLIALDTSGSVREDLVRAFFSELNKLYRLGVHLEILESDYQIQRRYTYAGVAPVSILGRGGTDYNPVFRFARDHAFFDALIYFTDGLAPPPQVSIKIPVLWVIFGTKGRSLNTWSPFPGQKLMIEI